MNCVRNYIGCWLTATGMIANKPVCKNCVEHGEMKEYKSYEEMQSGTR